MEASRLLHLGRVKTAHSMLLLVVIAVSWLTLVGVIVETAIITALDIHTDLLPEPTVNHTHFTLTPPTWTSLTLATASYIYQLIWLAYATSNIFRRCPTSTEQRIYVTAGSPPVAIFVSLIMTCIMIITADVLQNRIVSCLINFLIVATLHIGLGISHRDHAKYFLSLLLEGLLMDLILARVLIQNGMATLLTWRLLNFYSNLAEALLLTMSYKWVLGIICMHLLIWFILDMTALRGYVQFTFAPYVVLLFWTIGLCSRYHSGLFGSRFVIVIMSFDLLFLMLKILIMSWRYRRASGRQQEGI